MEYCAIFPNHTNRIYSTKVLNNTRTLIKIEISSTFFKLLTVNGRILKEKRGFFHYEIEYDVFVLIR